MNNDELITVVKERLAAVRSDTPLDAIVRRGRTVRARRRIFRVTAAVTVVCGLALTAATLLTSGSSQQQLTAWSVVAQRNGLVIVTIRQLRDPAGLQRKLHSDGVPATVRFTNHNPLACLYYPGSPARIFRLTNRIFPQTNSAQTQNGAAFVINTLAIPPGVGLWIEVTAPRTSNAGDGLQSVSFSTGEALVYASGHCPRSSANGQH
jgi:hypothetical protein